MRMSQFWDILCYSERKEAEGLGEGSVTEVGYLRDTKCPGLTL